MLPTPSTNHVNIDLVYEPAEDSFLFLDTLSSQAETQFLTQRFRENSYPDTNNIVKPPSPLVLEVGTGSGVVLAFITANAQKLLGRADVLTLGVDVNPFACQATVETVRRASKDKVGANLEHTSFLGVLHGDLTGSLRPGQVDLLVFNPPYVPTSPLNQSGISGSEHASAALQPQEQRLESYSQLLALSYAGGVDGMEVTNRLIEQIPSLLNEERGTAYILLCKQNNPEQLMKRILKWGPGWAAETVAHSGKTGGWEKLQLIRIWRV